MKQLKRLLGVNEMADEQELLSTKQWDKLCKEYPLLDFSFQDGYAEEFRIILKAMGYVKWDREKVAQMGYEFLGIGWDKLTEASKDIFRERADQIIALFPDEEERSIRINKILDRVNQQHAVELKDASCVGLENCCDLETRLKDARKQERDGMMALVETFMWFNNDDAACGLKAGSTKFTKVWQALKEE